MAKPSKHHKQPSNHAAQKPKPQPPAGRAEQPKQPGTWVRKKITATLQSDAHLGSGVGGQGLHALLARDRQGRPVIWSTHLEGLLREAERSLNPVDAKSLFGNAGGSRQQLVFTSLYLEQGKESPQSRVWRSTARASFDNRAPSDNTLRAIEFVPKGTKFEGAVELPEGDLPKLTRLLQEIESIGHGRATGAGLVSLSLSPAHMTLASPPPFKTKLILQLTNLDPLCIAKTATPGNTIPTQPYIPGRTLLGALASWLIAEGTDPAKNAAALLVNGNVSVSDALPIGTSDTTRPLSAVEVLPAPLSLQSKKPGGQAGDVAWWAKTKFPTTYQDKAKQDQDKQQEKLKRPEPDLFVQRIGSDAWETHRPDIRIRLRNGRPNPSAKDPSLFAIEQIAEDTQFLTVLSGEEKDFKALCNALYPVLSGLRWLRIGRSGAPVVVSRTGIPHDSGQNAATSAVAGKDAYLTLTSDLLFRDDQLRWQTRLIADNAKDLPGWPKEFSEALTEEIFKPVLQEETEIRGFNGTSGLWRLPSAGIRRGSVFKVNAALAKELQESACKGAWLGERAHEGFGRFRVDEEDQLPGVTAAPQKTTSAYGTRAERTDDPCEPVARETKRWSEAYAKANETESSPKPSLSQWQDLVTELESRKSDALESRENPTTVGAAGWKHPAAAQVLTTLKGLTAIEKRAEHARMFVRWVRAELKQTGAESKSVKQEVAR